MDELIFEHFGFRSALVVPAAAMAVLDPAVHWSSGACAARCGLVLDAGFSSTTAVPVFDARVVWPGVKRINLGGKALTNHLKELVSFRRAPAHRAPPSPRVELTRRRPQHHERDGRVLAGGARQGARVLRRCVCLRSLTSFVHAAPRPRAPPRPQRPT